MYYWYDAIGDTMIDKLASLDLYVKRTKVYNKGLESLTSGGVKQLVGTGY